MNSTNQISITIVTATLALLAVLTVATVCGLSFYSITIPPELNTLAGGLVGAVSTMLVKTTATSNAPAETKIVNSPTDPVQTQDVK